MYVGYGCEELGYSPRVPVLLLGCSLSLPVMRLVRKTTVCYVWAKILASLHAVVYSLL